MTDGNRDAAKGTDVDHRRHGTHVIVAAFPRGTAQKPMTCLVKRPDLERNIREAFGIDAETRWQIETYGPARTREYLAAPAPEGSAEETMFLSRIVAMLIATMSGSPDLADTCGLMAIALAIDPDESLGWRERGMLDPALMAQVEAAGVPVSTLKSH